MFVWWILRRLKSGILSPHTANRVKACRELSKLRDVRAIALLSYALRDADKDVRITAAQSLCEIGDPSAIEALVGVLEDDTKEVRDSALPALRTLGPRASEPLINALKRGEEHMRETAAELLGEIAERRSVEPLMNMLHALRGRVSINAVIALGKLGDTRALPSLAKLTPHSQEERAALRTTLEKLASLCSEDLFCDYLPSCRPPANEFSELVIARYRDEWPESLMKAAHSLGTDSMLEPLIHAFQDETVDMRWTFAEVLGKIGDTKAVEPLINALTRIADENEQRRGQAWNCDRSTLRLLESVGTALGCLRDTRAVEPLIDVLTNVTGDADEVISMDLWRAKGTFASALGQLGDRRAVVPLLNMVTKGAAPAGSLVHAVGKSGGVYALLEALEIPSVQQYACDELAKLRDETAVGALLKVAMTSDAKTQSHAAAALGEIGGEQAVSGLIDLLRGRIVQGVVDLLGGKVVQGVVDALGKIGDGRAAEQIFEVFQRTQDSFVRHSAALVLKQLNHGASCKSP